MSEELENDGTFSGLKKTIIGVMTTVIMGLGTWGVTKITGSEESTPATTPAPVINITNTNNQQQLQGSTKVIERVKEIPAKPAAPKKKTEKEQLEEAPAW